MLLALWMTKHIIRFVADKHLTCFLILNSVLALELANSCLSLRQETCYSNSSHKVSIVFVSPVVSN
eukprot:jgi/Botrbrau1/10432/Bobra.0133s0039.1